MTQDREHKLDAQLRLIIYHCIKAEESEGITKVKHYNLAADLAGTYSIYKREEAKRYVALLERRTEEEYRRKKRGLEELTKE
ncbi:MAG: hypothetical protein Q8R00_01105 [Candidatus Nanoarchaeia archaeon]|nr:hypothetical protein [Candidatus Nanoarchaeia archaeon]